MIGSNQTGALKTYINVNHIEEERWGPPLVDYDWYPSVRRCIKASKEKTWERCMKPTKKGAGRWWLRRHRKPKALWKMKAAKEAEEEYYNPTREDNIKGRNETRLALWGEPLKNSIVSLENRYWRSRPEYFWEGAFSNGCRWLPSKLVGKADLGGRLALLGSDG